MSKHVSRKQRWTEASSTQYVSSLGEVAYRQQAWYGFLEYRTLQPPAKPEGLPSWERHVLRLGPFKRPRNAMVALEREATLLKNRHGQNLLFRDQVWAET